MIIMIEFRVDKIKTDYNRRYGRPLANALGDADYRQDAAKRQTAGIVVAAVGCLCNCTSDDVAGAVRHVHADLQYCRCYSQTPLV